MATPGNLEQGAGRHSPGFCGNRREHGPSSPLMAPMAVIKAHLPRYLPAACASGLRLKLGPVARGVARSTAGFALFDRQSQGIAPALNAASGDRTKQCSDVDQVQTIGRDQTPPRPEVARQNFTLG